MRSPVQENKSRGSGAKLCKREKEGKKDCEKMIANKIQSQHVCRVCVYVGILYHFSMKILICHYYYIFLKSAKNGAAYIFGDFLNIILF